MIYLVRHGQTAQNQARLLLGRSDPPLNEAGLRQAAAAGDWFRARDIVFDRVYSSPLRRAMQTARLIAGADAQVIPDPRLIEMDYGPYEGMDLTRPAPEVLTFFRDFVHNPAPAGMEPLAEIVARLGAFLEELAPVAGPGNILISTHAIAMKGALEYLTPASAGSYWAKNIGNCAVYRTQVTEGGFQAPEELDLS